MEQRRWQSSEGHEEQQGQRRANEQWRERTEGEEPGSQSWRLSESWRKPPASTQSSILPVQSQRTPAQPLTLTPQSLPSTSVPLSHFHPHPFLPSIHNQVPPDLSSYRTKVLELESALMHSRSANQLSERKAKELATQLILSRSLTTNAEQEARSSDCRAETAEALVRELKSELETRKSEKMKDKEQKHDLERVNGGLVIQLAEQQQVIAALREQLDEKDSHLQESDLLTERLRREHDEMTQYTECCIVNLEMVRDEYTKQKQEIKELKGEVVQIPPFSQSLTNSPVSSPMKPSPFPFMTLKEIPSSATKQEEEELRAGIVSRRRFPAHRLDAHAHRHDPYPERLKIYEVKKERNLVKESVYYCLHAPPDPSSSKPSH